MSDNRKWQNGFESYEQTLSAIGTFKDGYGGTHRLDYRDLDEEADCVMCVGDGRIGEPMLCPRCGGTGSEADSLEPFFPIINHD